MEDQNNVEKQPRKHSIRTVTGKYFDFTEMDPETICIEDIAHALSVIPRFTGHTPQPYSVGQHCIMMALRIEGEFALEALLHDATEAYMNDIAKPLKDLLPDYRNLEQKLDRVIAEKFMLSKVTHALVKDWDYFLLGDEWKTVVIGPDAPFAWPAETVKRVFLELYEKHKRV